MPHRARGMPDLTPPGRFSRWRVRTFSPLLRRSSSCAPAGEICAHIETLVDDFDLRRRISFGTEVDNLSFDEATGVWTANIIRPSSGSASRTTSRR